MISHSAPSHGEYGEAISNVHMLNTRLDRNAELYMCYQHFDVAFLPGSERRIASVDGPYLGRMDESAWRYYKKQLKAVQEYRKGISFQRPIGLSAS